VLVALLIVVAFTIAACSSSGSSSPSTSGGSSSGSTSDSIAISNFTFVPHTISVAAGSTVTVTNRDQVTHTLTSSNGAFSTGAIGPGQSKTFTAPKKPGSYGYICSIHQYMTGTLVVSQ
jgi:plastocyanin